MPSTEDRPTLKFYQLNNDAILPVFATDQSACFDLRANLGKNCNEIKGYDVHNNRFIRYAMNPSNVSDQSYENVSARRVFVYPNERILIPTGLIFDIPVGYSVRLHPRSGLSLKSGITLSNSEGIIDSDYIEPVFVMILNTSTAVFTINHGDRICQAEMVKSLDYSIELTGEQPTIKTNRTGGLGSTGVQ